MLNSARLAENLARVRERIGASAVRSGRKDSDVTLVAVTKYAPAEVVPLLIAEGCRDLGESRPQALWHKAALFSGADPRWHMIGRVQRNKVRRTLPLVTLLHSLDDLGLLAEWSKNATPPPQRMLVEVNVSGDPTKHGIAPEALERFLSEAAVFPGAKITGLMTMAAKEGDLEVARRNFGDLFELSERLRGKCPPQIELNELSMGMSGDFEVAIEQGSTLVRIGSALFEGTEQSPED